MLETDQDLSFQISAISAADIRVITVDTGLLGMYMYTTDIRRRLVFPQRVIHFNRHALSEEFPVHTKMRSSRSDLLA